MRHFAAAILIATMLPAQVSGQIYRHVDEQGRVHFGERPREGAQRVEVRPQIIERDEAVRQREANVQRLIDVRADERALDRERLARDRENQQAVCQDLRQQLAQFDQRTFWYEVDEQGRRSEVPRARVEARKAELQTRYQERC
jgi:hypothetical protein